MQASFHIFKNLSLGIECLCSLGYKTLEIRIYSAELVYCIIILLVSTRQK